MEQNPELKSLLRQAAALNESISRLAGNREAVLFEQYARKHLEAKLMSPALREKTKRAFEYQVRCNLIPAFGPMPLGKIANTDWNAWIAKTRGAEHKTITRFFGARKSLVEILNAAKEEGLLERVPKFDNPDEAKNVGRILEEREVWAILRNTTYRIFRLFFFTMGKMGCRPREILQWEWAFVEWSEPGKTWINIPARISKTGRTRRIPLNPGVSKHLFRIFRRGPSSRFVFPNRIHPDQPQLSYHGAWKTACAKAGVKKTVPYDFRRTFITKAMAKNISPVFVGKHLDTSTKMIESVYTKSQEDVMQEIVS